MSVSLKFHRIDLVTERGTSRYDFRDGFNVITGSYGTGKSSLFELIKFALGSSTAKIMPTIRDNLRSVSLEATIGTSRVNLTRSIGKNKILVTDSYGLREEWTAMQGKLPRAGSRLLEVLGVPVTRLSRGGGSEPLSFFDLLKYAYLPQTDVNSSVAGHANTFTNRKRRAIFELAYGLADKEIRDLEVEAARLENLKQKTEQDAAAVYRFLSEFGVPSDVDLDAEEQRVRVDLQQAENRLRAARKNARQALPGDQESLRARISSLRTATADAETERAVTWTEVERGRALVAQLELDAQREERTASAAEALSGIDFVVCPRCLQSITERAAPEGCCTLCLQPQEIKASAAEAIKRELFRLKDQREEASLLLKEDEDRLNRTERELEALRQQLNEAAGELESQADPSQLIPSIDLTSEAAGDRERLRSKIRDIERNRDLWHQYGLQEEKLTRIRQEIDGNERQVTEAKQKLEINRSRVTDLGETFDEEIRELHFAGYETAGIDPITYLPVINGDTFDELSVSGARKTLANVSYYLSNLAMTLSHEHILLPGMLMLDSPRTSLGNTPEDVQAGQRLYYRMHLLVLAYPRCQIVIADNNIPQVERQTLRSMHRIELSYDRPLLQHVPHPGRDNVQTIGSSD
jgi:hypothetical protein